MVIAVFWATDDWFFVMPVVNCKLLIFVSSPVRLFEFTNCVPFHLKISPLLIDDITVSVNKLCVKFVLAHFELELYINACFVAGEDIEQSVSAANVDVPEETVALTQFVPFYCNIWFVDSDDIDTFDKVLIDGKPLHVNIPPLDKEASVVEL